jgi:hypothetical protein
MKGTVTQHSVLSWRFCWSCKSHFICQYVERTVLLLLQEPFYMPVCWADGSVAVARVTLYASMLSGWFCCCYKSHSMCFTMLSGWFCCCRRLTVVGSALRCSQTSWRTAQSARDLAAACVSRWSRGVPSSCRGTVFLPTPHNTPASPPFCASVGGILTLFTSRDKTSFILSLPCSPVGGRGLSGEHSTSIFRVKGCRVWNWLGYTGRLKRRWSLRSMENEEMRTNRDKWE